MSVGRDGFILSLSHSHGPNTGPIYAAFSRKVNGNDLLESSVLQGLLQFVAQCSINPAVENKYEVARCSFAVSIANKANKVTTIGDCGMFFNDTRKLTTVQEFMNLSFQLKEPADISMLRDIARYHVWTWGGSEATKTCLQADSFDSELLTTAKKAFAIQRVMNLENQAKNLHLTVETLEQLSEGHWKYLDSKDVCAGIYNGHWGKAGSTAIVSELLNRLYTATTIELFSLVAATLLVTTEDSYVKLGEEELVIVYKSDYDQFFEFSLCSVTKCVKMMCYCVNMPTWCAVYGTHRCPVTRVDVEAFSTDEYFASVAHLYHRCVNESKEFADLYNGVKQSIKLQCGFSLRLPFSNQNMSPRPAYSFTCNDLKRVVAAAVARVKEIASLKIKDNMNIRVDASKNDSISADGITIKWFGNELVTDKGKKRFSVFPRKRYDEKGEPESLWFLEIYPLPAIDYKKLYRCRFLMALPMWLLTYRINEFKKKITGHAFFTDSHYGQDVYAAAKATLDKKLLDINNSPNYNWVDNGDYLDTVTLSCKEKEYFPFQFIGDIEFSLKDDTVSYHKKDEVLPSLFD